MANPSSTENIRANFPINFSSPSKPETVIGINTIFVLTLYSVIGLRNTSDGGLRTRGEVIAGQTYCPEGASGAKVHVWIDASVVDGRGLIRRGMGVGKIVNGS
jgi:hypothetical protein